MYQYHPETKEDEVFFENVYEKDIVKINKYNDSPNYRIGKSSFTNNHEFIPEMKPVFILKEAIDQETNNRRENPLPNFKNNDMIDFMKQMEKIVSNFQMPTNPYHCHAVNYSDIDIEGIHPTKKLYYCTQIKDDNEPENN